MRRSVALFLLAIGSAMQPQAANNTQKDMFAESDAYERFMGRWSRLLAPLLVRFASIGEREPGR